MNLKNLMYGAAAILVIVAIGLSLWSTMRTKPVIAGAAILLEPKLPVDAALVPRGAVHDKVELGMPEFLKEILDLLNKREDSAESLFRTRFDVDQDPWGQ